MLLDVNYTARLADFGYASLVGNIPEALTYLQRSTARPGALRWSAPEQVDPEETFNMTTKTDIYSFGCVALQEGSLTDSEIKLMLTPLQVFSGKQPWSEVQGDSAIVLRLAKGHKPGRPESRTLNDSHWNLIQDCWSAIEERPAAGVIIRTIKQLLSHCPQSPPLSDLLPAWSSEADLGAESSSSLSQTPTDGSSTHATSPVNKTDTPASASIRIPSFSLDQSEEGMQHRISLVGNQSRFRASSAGADEQRHSKRRRV